jgi:hypothetical protein
MNSTNPGIPIGPVKISVITDNTSNTIPAAFVFLTAYGILIEIRFRNNTILV